MKDIDERKMPKRSQFDKVLLMPGEVLRLAATSTSVVWYGGYTGGDQGIDAETLTLLEERDEHIRKLEQHLDVTNRELNRIKEDIYGRFERFLSGEDQQ